MLGLIKYHWHLNKLRAQQNKDMKKFKEYRKKAKPEELDSLHAEEGAVYFETQNEIDELVSRRFIQIANDLLIPLPNYNDKEHWARNLYDNSYVLTVKGIWELKKLIRQEKKERMEGFIIWILALTGIIGATTGLAAVLLR